jgi:isopentenyl phosphate kinase
MKAVVKLGGSLLTYKDICDYPKGPCDVYANPGKYLRLDVMKKIANIIEQAKNRDKKLELILVTGAGCCGHPQVKAGFSVPIIQDLAITPATYLSNALYKKEIDTGVMSPAFFVKCSESDGKQGTDYETTDIWRFTDNFAKCILISYGDVIKMVEGKTGRLGDHEVLSGDDLITYFGEAWPADKVISVSDVNGVYAEFPPKEGQKPIARILANEPLRDDAHFKYKMEDLYKVKFKDINDATGGLFAKVRKLYDFTQETGTPSQLVGLNNLGDVLRGYYAGTLIEKTA